MFKGLWFFIKFGWKQEKKYIIYLFLRQILSSLIPIVGIIMPRYIIDELMEKQRVEYFVLYIGILLGYILLAGIATNYLVWQGFNYRILISAEFDVYLNSRTMNVDYADLESSEYLDIKEKADKFLFGKLSGFSYVLDISVDIIGKAITLLAVIAIIFSLNLWLVAIFILLVSLTSLFEGYARKKQMELSLKVTSIQRRWMYFSDLMEDFSYGKEVRINGLDEWLIDRFRQFNHEGNIITFKSNNYGKRSGLFSSITSFIQQLISYVYLTKQVIEENITIGEFSMYIGGVLAFSNAMRSVLKNIIEVSQFRHYYDALEKYLNIPFRMQDNKRLPISNKEHTIEFRNVSFKYNNANDYALKNISVILNSGTKLSVVGENGAGKTTFVKLLSRIYDPTEGDVYLDGINIKDIDYKQYMKLFSTVFQDFKLFSFTLLENVALADSDNADEKEVTQALIRAGFGDKLKSLKDGLNTNIYKNFNDEGFEPSGGEGQKIALARAIYKDAPFVILDEPTSALDPKAEYEMYMNFDKLVSKDKTAVYISHRLASTKFCDKILVFLKGEIVEKGSHEELIANKLKYYEMYNMQSKFYQE